jgi:phage terminase large subunit GpA-like protein
MHLPDFVDDEYLAQLTAEKRVRRIRKGGRIVREYVKTRARNEALDLEVYALAALYTAGPWRLKALGELAKQMSAPPDEVKPQGEGNQGTGSRRPTGGGGWVKSW